MRKFLFLFVLLILIKNVNAYIIEYQPHSYTAKETQQTLKEMTSGFVVMQPFGKSTEISKIKCIDGDTLHLSIMKNYRFTNGEVVLDNATYAYRIAGIDTFDSKSKKMIEKQKKTTKLSETEIKKKAKQGKEYCEEYFIKNKKCDNFYIFGVDPYGRYITIPCDGEYQRNLVDKGLATIYKGNDLYTLIFD